MEFRSSHKPYHSRYTNTFRIHPDNCLQWLNTSVKNRISALDKSKARQLCHIWLSIPDSWNKPGSGCDGAHALMRRASDRHASQLLVVKKWSELPEISWELWTIWNSFWSKFLPFQSFMSAFHFNKCCCSTRALAQTVVFVSKLAAIEEQQQKNGSSDL